MIIHLEYLEHLVLSDELLCLKAVVEFLSVDEDKEANSSSFVGSFTDVERKPNFCCLLSTGINALHAGSLLCFCVFENYLPELLLDKGSI